MTMEVSIPQIYLAAPFFNPEQVELVARLESVLDGSGFKVYSPRRDGGEVSPASPKEERQSIFHSNIKSISRSDLVVAVVDSVLCKEADFAIKKPTPEGDVYHPLFEIFTDPGTAFDLGVSYAMEVPSILYNPASREGEGNPLPLNLMLGESAWGYCETLPELIKMLEIANEAYASHYREAKEASTIKYQKELKDRWKQKQYSGRVI